MIENVLRDFRNNSIQKQDQLKVIIMLHIRGGAQKTEEKQQIFHRQRLLLPDKNSKSKRLDCSVLNSLIEEFSNTNECRIVYFKSQLNEVSIQVHI